MSYEARITELENETSTLRKQVGDLRELLEVELERMRAEIQALFGDAKQLLLDRESEATTRIAQLEAEVARLTHACEQAMLKEDLVSCLLPTRDALSGPRADKAAEHLASRETKLFKCGEVKEDTTSLEKVLSIPQSAAVEPAASDDASHIRSAVEGLQGRLEKVYDFYTATSIANAEMLHPAMHLSHFTTMVRDAELCGGQRSFPPELLWMAVMRSFAPAPAEGKPARRSGSTLLLPRVFGDENQLRKSDSFARERLLYIARSQFLEALYAVYCATCARPHNSPPSPERFRTFLVDIFLPAVERRMRQRESRGTAHAPATVALNNPVPSPSSREASVALSAVSSAKPNSSTTNITFADTVASYQADEAVRKLVQQFTPHLKQAFLQAVQGPPHLRLSEARMSVEAFAECVRQHKLLPLLSRLQVKAIFLFCLGAQSVVPGAVADECITYASYVTAMYCLAEQIYSCDAALQRQYPSSSARLSKLFVKMFVL